MYKDNSYILVNWNLYLTDNLLASTMRYEGVELNPFLFKTYKIKLLSNTISELRQSLSNMQTGFDGFVNYITQPTGEPLTEQETLSQSFIGPSGSIAASGTSTTTVGIYHVEEGEKYYVEYQTGNSSTRPYKFYNENDGVLSDDNDFPEITGSGIYVIYVLVAPKNAVTLKITYNNTVPVTISKCTERYLQQKDIRELENSVGRLANIVDGANLSTEVQFTEAWQMQKLPFTILKGSVVTLSGDITSITCRTNSDDDTYQALTSGTIADRDINYVRNQDAAGDCTINAVLDGLLQRCINEINETNKIANEAKEGAGIAYRISSKFKIRPFKILGVGNSWTNNATAFLGNILSSLGVKVEIGVSYAGGASIQSYWNNIESNAAAYQFRKWKEGKGWIEPDENSTYKDILLADDWDIITHQQQSGNGGNYSSFQPYLHNIINWEKGLVKVMPLFFMHATWAYPNGYDYEQFETLYGSNTDTMYNAILDAYNQAMVDEGITNIMPSAPMIQQVRTLGISDIDTGDGGSHLSTNGQFAASCVWAEMLLRNYLDPSVASDLSIVNSTYKPSTLSDENALLIRNLAKTIVENVRTYFPMQK